MTATERFERAARELFAASLHLDGETAQRWNYAVYVVGQQLGGDTLDNIAKREPT